MAARTTSDRRAQWQAWVIREIGGSPAQIQACTNAALAALANRRPHDEIAVAARAAAWEPVVDARQRRPSSSPRRPRVGIADAIAFLTAWTVWMLASLTLGAHLVEIPSHGLPVIPLVAGLTWLVIAVCTGRALYAHVGPWRFAPVAAAVTLIGALIVAQGPIAAPGSPTHLVVVHAPASLTQHASVIE